MIAQLPSIATLTLRWKFKAGGAIVSSPSAADGIVYFSSQDKNVYAVSSSNGGLIWKFATNARLVSSPAVVNGRVYIGPDDGTIYCFDAYNGSLIWSTLAGGYVEAYFAAAVNLRSSPTVVDGKVYVGALDKKLYCLDANSGDVKWSFLTNGSITSSPAVAGGVVYITSQEPQSGGLYMLNAADGGLIRRIVIPYQQASRGTDIHSSVAVADGMIFAASNKQTYYGINATTGNVVWNFSDPDAEEFIIASPIYLDGKVFLVDQFFIVAVDALTGNPLWKAFVGTEFYVSPTYAADKLYVTSDQRGLYVLNATDGSKVSFFATGSNSWSSPTLYDGKVYVGNNDWNVYCISDYPLLSSSVVFELADQEVALGESVSGCGYLVPGMANESIMLSFVKPDGAVSVVQVATYEKGYFDFTFSPNVIGDWTVAAQWQSDRDYYNSAYSEESLLRVSTSSPEPFPPEWFSLTSVWIIGSIIAAIAVIGLGYVYIKRRSAKK